MTGPVFFASRPVSVEQIERMREVNREREKVEEIAQWVRKQEKEERE